MCYYISMNLDAIFKAYDIRGLVPDELDENVTHKVGRGLADFLYETVEDTRHLPVVVGRDMREDSSSLAAAVMEGLTRQGREVIDIGQITTDMIYFATGYLGAAAGVVVTASHNPGAYNGMKLCREGSRAIGVETGLLDIKDRVATESFQEADPASVSEYNVMDDWVEHALGFAPGLRPFHIAIDAGNGMAGAVIPHVQGETSLHITPLFFELDGTFPNHEANPIKPGTLHDLQRAVVDNGLDFGIAFDGDGDRMVLVDEKGGPVSGSITTAILARHFLHLYPGSAILHNAITSRVVPETIQQYGGTPILTKVGHSYIKADMRTHDAPFGGEHSAHYYFRDNWYADSGLIAAMAAMEVLSSTEQTLSELAAPYREAYSASGEINFEVEDKEAMIENIAREFSDGEHDRMDGLTVSYEDWWFNIRPSNTEPLLRLNIEARQADTLSAQQRRLENILSA